jgi:hypothetical protein
LQASCTAHGTRAFFLVSFVFTRYLRVTSIEPLFSSIAFFCCCCFLSTIDNHCFFVFCLRTLSSDLTSEKSSNATTTSFSLSMYKNRASSPKSCGFASHLSTQHEEIRGSNGTTSQQEKTSQRRTVDIGKKPLAQSKHPSSASTSTSAKSNGTRRLSHNDGATVLRGRSNTDVQTTMIPSNTLKQQCQTNNAGSDKSLIHSNQTQSQSSPSKLPCSLPSSTSQPGCVTPSKLFNMMGYGLQNHYLFMHPHYLYIIDCRSKDQFNDNHIATGRTRIIADRQTTSTNSSRQDCSRQTRTRCCSARLRVSLDERSRTE